MAVDFVTRLSAYRATDFRLGERLGPCDHIVTWTKPSLIRGLTYRQYHDLPESIRVRECRVKLSCRGFRSKVLVLATTLLDATRYPKEDLAELYRVRWNAELDLRSLKTTLQMAVLRCKTPELVRKMVWTHVLAYNLIRTLMAQAAHKHDLPPREISFEGAVQTLEAFAPLINSRVSSRRRGLCDELLDAVASHHVGDRPGRVEPRRLKRRQKKYDLMTSPRQVLKAQMAKGVVLK